MRLAGLHPPGEVFRRSDQEEAVIEEIITFVSQYNASKYLTVASAAWLLWDMILTMDQEVDLIWLSKPSLTAAKLLFYINRYFVLFVVTLHLKVSFTPEMSNKLCDLSNDFFTFATVANVTTVEAMVLLRVWALYNKDKRVLAGLLSLYTVSLVTTLVVLSVGITASSDITSPAPTIAGCLRVLPSYFTSVFFASLVDQTVFFAMTFMKAYHSVKSEAKTPILSALVRDGSILYLMSLWSMTFMVAGTFIVPLKAAAYASLFINVAFGVMGSRLTLSIRAMNISPRNPTSIFSFDNMRSKITNADVPVFAPADDDAIPLVDVEQEDETRRDSASIIYEP